MPIINLDTCKPIMEVALEILFKLSAVDFYYFLLLQTGFRVSCRLGNCFVIGPHLPALDGNREASTKMVAHDGTKTNETFCGRSCGTIYYVFYMVWF